MQNLIKELLLLLKLFIGLSQLLLVISFPNGRLLAVFFQLFFLLFRGLDVYLSILDLAGQILLLVLQGAKLVLELFFFATESLGLFTHLDLLLLKDALFFSLLVFELLDLRLEIGNLLGRLLSLLRTVTSLLPERLLLIFTFAALVVLVGLVRSQGGVTLVHFSKLFLKIRDLLCRLLLLRLDLLNAGQQLLIFGELLLHRIFVLSDAVAHRRNLLDRPVVRGHRLSHVGVELHVLKQHLLPFLPDVVDCLVFGSLKPLQLCLRSLDAVHLFDATVVRSLDGALSFGDLLVILI